MNSDMQTSIKSFTSKKSLVFWLPLLIVCLLLTPQIKITYSKELPTLQDYLDSTPWEVKDGVETRIVRLPGKVSLHQERIDGKISTFTFDESGNGALLCALHIYSALNIHMQNCPGTGNEWRTEMSSTVERLSSFVIENSMGRISSEDIRQLIEQEQLKYQEKTGRNYCEVLSGMTTNLKKFGLTEFRKEAKKLMSTPRFPVIGPCL